MGGSVDVEYRSVFGHLADWVIRIERRPLACTYDSDLVVGLLRVVLDAQRSATEAAVPKRRNANIVLSRYNLANWNGALLLMKLS